MFCSFKIFVSSSLIVTSASFNMSTNLQIFLSVSSIDDGCDALFFIANFLYFGVSVITRTSVICFFLKLCF